MVKQIKSSQPRKPRKEAYGSAIRRELRDKITKARASLRQYESDLRSITPKRKRSKLQAFHEQQRAKTQKAT